MYIHIGKYSLVRDSEIIGIFDMDNTTVMKKTLNYLSNAEKENRVKTLAPYELPKSFVVCESSNETTVYITPVSVGTILKRAYSENN